MTLSQKFTAATFAMMMSITTAHAQNMKAPNPQNIESAKPLPADSDFSNLPDGLYFAMTNDPKAPVCYIAIGQDNKNNNNAKMFAMDCPSQ